MQQLTPPIELPNVNPTYEPEPGSFAGFIAGMSAKVDELLTAAHWQPNLE
jgi:hypothetical protein